MSLSYPQFLEHLKTYEGLEIVVKLYTPDFHKIQDYANQFKNDMMQNGQDLDEAMKVNTGIFAILNPLVELLDAHVKWVQDKQAEDKKQKIIGAMDADFLYYCRTVRAAFKGQARSAEQMIYTCQTGLREAEKEKRIG